jgi:hypothetical protein
MVGFQATRLGEAELSRSSPAHTSPVITLILIAMRAYAFAATVIFSDIGGWGGERAEGAMD